MGKFNAKSEPKRPTEINFMGEKAFKMEDKEELVSTVMTTFLTDTYYEKETTLTKRIQTLLDKVDPLFSAKLAIYARNEGNLRSVTHLVAAYLARMISGRDWGKRFYNKIVIRPDDMSEIICCYAALTGQKDVKNIHKIPNAIKKGFKTALERFDAYQIDKYKMERRQVKLIDIVNLLHPKGTQKNAEAYRRLVAGESLEGLYETKILEKEMSKAGQKAKTQEEKEEAKHDAIADVLDNVKGMPMMNLLRNLRNILLYAPDKVNDACWQLTTKEKVLNSRLLPFRYATAYSEIEKVFYEDKALKTSIAFKSDKKKVRYSKSEFNTCKTKVLNAIEKAIQLACLNIPKLDGNVAVLIDHSGSCRSDAGGSSKVSAFSKTTTAMIGNLFGSMLAYRQDNVYIGLFGDRLISVPMDRKKPLLEFNADSYKEGARCGGATEAGIYEFLRTCVKEKKKVDNVVVFSDCQIGNGISAGSFTSWYGHSYDERSTGFFELFKQFKKINPGCNFIVCNLRQSGGTSVFDKSMRVLNIAGWSDKIFDTITSNCKGWDAVIKEIEAIEI